jgi:hypothetical protein
MPMASTLIASLPYLFLLFLVASCQSDKPHSSEPVLSTTEEKSSESFRFFIDHDPVYLYDKPGFDQKARSSLSWQEAVIDLGEVSPFTTTLLLGGQNLDEPWLKVRTAKGEEGWIYGGFLKVDPLASKDGKELWEKKRLQALLGKDLFTRMMAYRENWDHAESDAEIAMLFRAGKSIQADLNQRLFLKYTDQQILPDLFWMAPWFPGLSPELIHNRSRYHFFLNFGVFFHRSTRSQGDADNRFFKLQLQLYPQDSIEYFYPSWMIPLAEKEAHNLLGRGLQLSILKQMGDQLKKDSLFAPEYRQIAHRLAHDISRSNATFWEERDKILQELDSILALPEPILDKRDLIALQTKRRAFAHSEQNGILMNVKSGMN